MFFSRIRHSIYAGFLCILSGCIWIYHNNLVDGIQDFKSQKYHDAFVRLKPEAMRGQIDAEYAIGYMYYYGQGITEDRAKAIYWIQRAACGGQPDARSALELIAVEYSYSCEHKPGDSP